MLLICLMMKMRMKVRQSQTLNSYVLNFTFNMLITSFLYFLLVKFILFCILIHFYFFITESDSNVWINELIEVQPNTLVF
jgi:hypothetical protein